MTREEFEQKLLMGEAIQFGDDGQKLQLTTDRSIRLASVLFQSLRTGTADALKRDEVFFEALESVCESEDNQEAVGATDTQSSQLDLGPKRSWRLKKVETRQFGGLNSSPGDLFEFDANCQDWCIEGQNGSGKSSLANAILFALTGSLHRDQLGVLDAPSTPQLVANVKGDKIAEWPPVVVYPSDWEQAPSIVDLSVKLVFGNDEDSEEAVASRRLHGRATALQEEVSIDPRLCAVPALLEAGLRMPMRVQHIRVPQSDDNEQLVGLVRELLGLEPLREAGILVAELCHGGRDFLKHAKINGAKEHLTTFNDQLTEAQREIAQTEIDVSLSHSVEYGEPIDEKVTKLVEDAKQTLDSRQAQGFDSLSVLAFEAFDSTDIEHRNRIRDAINTLYVYADAATQPENFPPILRELNILASNIDDDTFELLKSTIVNARTQLEAALEWDKRQREDTRLRLKAIASEHYVDCGEPLCPLCEQSIAACEHTQLVDDLRYLSTSSDAAQKKLQDACRKIRSDTLSATRDVVPEIFLAPGHFSINDGVSKHIEAQFVKTGHSRTDLPGFRKIADEIIKSTFQPVAEFEFGLKKAPTPDDLVEELKGLLGHLENIIEAAVRWRVEKTQYQDAWERLFRASDPSSLASKIADLRKIVETIDPFHRASDKVSRALSAARLYNPTIVRQRLREKITKDLSTLKELVALVNFEAQATIKDVSSIALSIHQQIYNPEELTYREAAVEALRGRQKITFRASVGGKSDWTIDASLLANTSWMRGILWSFIFAIRQRAIEGAGFCPFNLILLDDPQVTFDTRNLRGWTRFLGMTNGIKQQQPCQLLITTHNDKFATEMTVADTTLAAEIEAGTKFSNPAQIVIGDFAEVRFSEMIQANSDDLAKDLISKIRILAETLLKHSLELFESRRVREDSFNLGAIMGSIESGVRTRNAPYTDSVFRDLNGLRASKPEMFRLLNAPHHDLSETITVGEAELVYEFWRRELFPAVRAVWAEYRFMQKVIIGEPATISLPANLNHRPEQTTNLQDLKPRIIGRVAAYSDGRTGSAIDFYTNEVDEDVEELNMAGLAAYRLEADTFSPVANPGDILLTNLDPRVSPGNLVVEDREEFLAARRMLVDPVVEELVILSASPSNPRKVPNAIISRKVGAKRWKVSAILFASNRVSSIVPVSAGSEAVYLGSADVDVADLVSKTQALQIVGSSAEPIALDGQYLLVKPPSIDVGSARRLFVGRPVVVEDVDGNAYFKRLRLIDNSLIALESLDKSGLEGLVVLATSNDQPGYPLVRTIRQVVGVVFDQR